KAETKPLRRCTGRAGGTHESESLLQSPHVPIKIIGVCEAMALVTAVVVGFVGVGNNEMRVAGDLDPIREFVVERIPIIEKATGLNEQAPRVRPGPPGQPAFPARAS